jgi:hypothetical protein
VKLQRFAAIGAVPFAIALLTPAVSAACACGCGVFDVGAGTMMPSDSPSGATVWFRYDFMDQDQNWEGGGKAPASDNSDKKLQTSFYTVGGEYRINHDWTVMAELPTFSRALTTTDDGTVFGPAGTRYTGRDNTIGDLQLSALYTGFAEDMSTGLSFGIKLPTGDSKGPIGPLGGAEFDRDSLPGTGSTDLMVGGYHAGALNASGKLSYFVQARYQVAIATRGGYRPGNELDGAAGVSYNVGAVGPLTKVAPVLQLIDSYRVHDSGPAADPLNSGYERALIAPGIDLRMGKAQLYADVEIPVYQHMNAAPSVAIEGTSGQLTAQVLYKVQMSYDF